MKQIITYLTFDGKTREAMEFYKDCLGGELFMMPFSEGPGEIPKEAKNRTMHASLRGGTFVLMASDTMPGMEYQQGNNFSICTNPESREEAEKLFSAFSREGKVTMPLQDTFWGAYFGTVTDRFGVNWMFNFEKPKE
jgi:PhnB protein